MAQDTWKDVRSKVEGLGLKLKLHLEQEDEDEAGEGAEATAETDEETGAETDGETGTGTETETEDGRAGGYRKAIEGLGERLEDAFEAFGSAAKDPAVRADVKEIGVLLKNAIQETLAGVGAEVRQAGERVKESASRGGGAASEAADADSPLKDSPDDSAQDTVQDTSGDDD